MSRTLRIATRKSELAIRQTESVAAALARIHPGLRTQLVPLSTRGDRIQDRPLSAIGGKALFLKELEQAMLDGRADVAVHSMKDVPAQLAAGFELAAVLAREDPFDAFVSNRQDTFDSLPHNAILGTSSLRRQSLAKAQRPDLQVASLRGNVNTRLAKLDAGDFDAIVLAAVGLRRLGFDGRIREHLKPPVWVPAAGQGALGVECRADHQEIKDLLRPLADTDTSLCSRAERAVVRCLEGSCQVPVGAYAYIEHNSVHLSAMVGRPDGTQVLRGERSGVPEDAQALGDALGAELLNRGGAAILRALESDRRD